MTLYSLFQTASDVITAGADGIAAIKSIMDGKPSPPPPFTPTFYVPNMNQRGMALKCRFILRTAHDVGQDLEQWKAIFDKVA